MKKNGASFNYGELLSAILILLPLLFINVRSSQHWGDDFSLYIQQAINIAEGKPCYQSTYIYLPHFSSLIPLTPPGYSLILAPLYKLAGLNITAFVVFQSVQYLAFALLCFYFFRKYFGLRPSLALVFAAFYPNFMLWMKLLITSDISFAIMLMAVCFLLMNAKQNELKSYLLAGLITGFAIATRSVGFILLPAVWLWQIFPVVRNFIFPAGRNTGFTPPGSAAQSHPSLLSREGNVPLAGQGVGSFYLPLFVFTCAAIAVHLLVSKVLFPASFDNFAEVKALISWHQLGQSLISNSIHYSTKYMELLSSTDPQLAVLSRLVSIIFFILTLIGFLIKFFRKPDLFDFICVAYLLFIFAFPLNADYRYILPVHAFLFFYFFYACKNFGTLISAKSEHFFTASFALLIAFLFFHHINYLIKTRKDVLPGPYEAIAQETFTYLQKNISDADMVVFNKPRALALYTQKKTTMYNWDADAGQNFKTLHQHGAKYYLYSWMLDEKPYTDLIEVVKLNSEIEYKNWQFVLYKDTTGQ